MRASSASSGQLWLLLRDVALLCPSPPRSPIFPIALSILIGFVVAQIFFAVYEMAIDTILLAFCEDCEIHNGTPKWAPPLLMEAMGLDGSRDRPEASSKDRPEASKSSNNAVAPYTN